MENGEQSLETDEDTNRIPRRAHNRQPRRPTDASQSSPVVQNGHSDNSLESDLVEDCVPTQIAYQRLHGIGDSHHVHEMWPTRRQQSSRSVSNAAQQRPAPPRNIDEAPLTLQSPNNPFNRESERLKTFQNWPKGDIVSPGDLARDGFVYMKKDDHVQCIFCRGILSGWSNGDSVIIEHRRHYPYCNYIKGEQVGNVPLLSNNFIAFSGPQSAISSRSPPSHGQRGEELFSRGNVSDARRVEAIPEIKYQKPKYPEYANEATRLQTYTSWPAQMKQTPVQLTKAGLYYMGQGDRVKCFHCGGVLYDWEPEDDPWVEHAKWFKDCSFLKLMKGDNFFQEVQQQESGGASRQPTSPGNVMNGEAMQLALSEAENTAKPTNSNTPVLMETEETSADPSTSSNTHKPTDKAGMNETEETATGKDVNSILQENRDLKEERLCKICMEEAVSVTFVPCGHLVCCAGCAAALAQCPICRQAIEGVVKTYWT